VGERREYYLFAESSPVNTFRTIHSITLLPISTSRRAKPSPVFQLELSISEAFQLSRRTKSVLNSHRAKPDLGSYWSWRAGLLSLFRNKYFQHLSNKRFFHHSDHTHLQKDEVRSKLSQGEARSRSEAFYRTQSVLVLNAKSPLR